MDFLSGTEVLTSEIKYDIVIYSVDLFYNLADSIIWQI